MKKVLFFCLGLLCLGATIRDAAAQPRYSEAELSADLDTLCYTIRESHPDLFFILPQTEFEQELEQVRARLADSMTRLDFYVLAAPLVARLGDGHTGLWFSDADFEQAKLLPYSLEIDAAEVVLTVAHDLSGAADPIPAGARIVSVNGKPVRQMMQELLPFVSGESDRFRMQSIARRLAAFHYMLYRDTVFQIEYDSGGQLQNRTRTGISAADYESRLRATQAEAAENPYSLRIDEEKRVAVIDFREFVYDQPKAVAFLDSTFSLLREKGIEDLVIDIRRNGGGNSSLGDEFFQYLSPVPFAQFGTVRLKYGEPMARREHIPDWKVGEVLTFEQSEEDLIPLRDNPLRYTGRTYLLTSNYTFSSATDFAWTFHHFGMGTIIGEETGGWVVTFGDVLAFTLPNTGMNYGVSFKEFYGYGATEGMRHGVIPDYPVPAAGAMETAYELIEAARK